MKRVTPAEFNRLWARIVYCAGDFTSDARIYRIGSLHLFESTDRGVRLRVPNALSRKLCDEGRVEVIDGSKKMRPYRFSRMIRHFDHEHVILSREAKTIEHEDDDAIRWWTVPILAERNTYR